MSLISGQNFIAPFTNKTHLFSIVVLSLLFGVYRWSGGTARVQRVDEPRREAVSPAAPGRPSAGSPVERKRFAPTDDDELVKSILDRQSSSAAPERPAAGQNTSKNSLEDIKRQLGLR